MKQCLILTITAMCIAIGLMGSTAAQDAITVSFSNSWQNGATTYLMPGNTTITFTTSIVTAPINGGTNGFRIWVPEGGVFGPVSGSFPLQPGWDGGCFADCFSCDGIGDDTVGFGGYAIYGSGLPVGTNVYYNASLNVPADLAERHLCIDTVFYPPGGVWLWSTDVGDVVPDWYDQPYCLTIYGCAPGKLFSNWPEATLTYDHCGLASYDFDTPDEANGLAAYTMMGGPGSVDPVTGVWTYQPSLADVGQALSVGIGAYSCDYRQFEVMFTNMAPTIACGPAGLAEIEIPYTRTIEKNDVDCDSGTFSIVSVTPIPNGTYDIDPVTGLFTYVPHDLDDMRLFWFVVQYTDGNLSDACELNIEAHDLEADCSFRGDVDGNMEGPNISDLTAMVDFFFRGGFAAGGWAVIDVNDDHIRNVADLTYFVNFLFRGGPAPVPCS